MKIILPAWQCVGKEVKKLSGSARCRIEKVLCVNDKGVIRDAEAQGGKVFLIREGIIMMIPETEEVIIEMGYDEVLKWVTKLIDDADEDEDNE